MKLAKVLFILGLPGSGKGTQSILLSQKFNLLHLSAGELLRKELMKNSQATALIKQCMNDGKLVPVEITCDLLKQEIMYNLFLIDGFPRDFDNITGWEKEMAHCTEIVAAIVLQCQVWVIKDRILKRSSSNEKRFDDATEILNKRICGYERETVPMLNKLSKMTKLIKVDANRGIMEIHKDLVEILNKLI